ncbi:MAG: competence protein CoiA family protein [Deltaproteobacteria bacterium]|nr:competence protein CoiA family protein [Deltaproteobacteria bacterium]
MAFIAQNKASKERIDITKFAQPREDLCGCEFECRLCNIQMFIRRSPQGRFHFFHKRSCTSDYQSHPESPEHLSGKSFVAEYIFPKLIEYSHFNPLFEEPLAEVKRVADIIAKFPMGWWFANEIQLAPITAEKLEKRTQDYLNAGVDVIWWFGKSADTRQNREWAVNKFGFSPYLVFNGEVVTEYGYWKKDVYRDEYGLKKEGLKRIKHLPAEESVPSFGWPHIIEIIGNWWVELAFVRYFQVWKNGNNARFERGLLANSATIRSFSGRVGAGNGTRFRKIKDIWQVREDEFYPFMQKHGLPVLPEEAVSIVKEKALKYRKDTG